MSVTKINAGLQGRPLVWSVSTLPGHWVLAYVLYATALLLPNLTLLYNAPTISNLGKLVLCAGFLSAWHLAFANKFFAVMTLLPAFLLLPFDLFVAYTYGDAPASAMLAIVFDTNLREALDYLEGRVLLALAASAASLSVWAWALSVVLRRRRALPAVACEPPL